MLTSDFDYELPPTAIAQEAIEPRDSARLLRVDTMSDHSFADLPKLLRAGDLLVVNRTRVRRARLAATRRETGGSVELLLLRPTADAKWEALARPARRLRPGVELDIGPISATVTSGPVGGVVEVILRSELPIEDAISAVGRVPLPPYFHGALPDPERYQTMFATSIGSAAAPTAALHFTPLLVTRLEDAGVEFAQVELDVGLDTFRPMDEGPIADHVMHTEEIETPPQTVDAVERTRRRGGRVIAVGTTALRTLEASAADEDGYVRAGAGSTDLFIAPGYRPRVVDALITNFHAPRTTLIVLIAGVFGPRWRQVYQAALERGYRFLSFGDAMFIERIRGVAP